MLAHVAETTAFIVPITAMRAAETVRMVRLHGRRAHIHVPIQIPRYRLRFRIHQAAPFLDLQSAALDDDGFTLFQQAAFHDLAREKVLRIMAGPEASERADLKNPSV